MINRPDPTIFIALMWHLLRVLYFDVYNELLNYIYQISSYDHTSVEVEQSKYIILLSKPFQLH